MPTSIYPRRSITSPDAEMLRPPATPIPKCWEAELRPLTFLAGAFDGLPNGEVKLALLLRGTAEGARVQEVSAPGYERQAVGFRLHEPRKPTANIHPVVFRFDEQPNSTIPLIGLYVGGRLMMRGGLTRVLIPPDEIDLSYPQVRLGSGALKLRF